MTFFENNPWVGYAHRSYMVMKSEIITKMQNPVTGIAEITDHSESNPFIKRLSIWCGINEMLGYYIDNKGREAHLLTARLYNSMINHARQNDYRVRGVIPATGEVTFTSNIPVASDYTIPTGTVVKTAAGVQFMTLADGVISTGDTEVTVAIRQWKKVAASVIGVSNGSPDQVFTLTSKVADNSPIITVGVGTPFTSIESFVFAKFDDNVFKNQMNASGLMEIVFGDNINGAIPVNGDDITVEYYESEGAGGNVAAGLINDFVTVLIPPVGAVLTVANETTTVNGTNAEGINELRKYIPLSLRTLYRAVTEQDYIDVAELAPGVARAGVTYDCGKFVDIYIAPNGGGIASLTLRSDTYDFMEDRKIINRFHRVNSAGLVIVEYEISVFALPYFYNATVLANVLATLANYHDVQNQKISGSVQLGNIYQAVEGTTGVDYCVVNLMRPMPYARPLDTATPVMDWDRQQTDTSVNATYMITFINTTDFKLIRNSIYLGTYSVGVLVTTDDLTFTVNTGLGYVASNAYEFKTYEVVNSIVLSEPSLPSFDPAHATITVTGGLI